MQSDWFDTTIGAQATLQRGFDITKANQRAGSVPVVSSAGISSYHDTASVSGPGVVLGRKGVVGSVYYIEEDFWPHDTTLWVKDFHGNNPRFVYYFFSAFSKGLAGLDVGSANPTLNRNHVHPISVLWPSVRMQNEIATVLGALDDRIDLLRDANATIESIATAVFKRWFIDFDPVRAKAEGREPEGMSADFAALFPSEFIDSELGLIPKGWQVRSIGDVVECVGGGTPSTKEPAYWEGGTHNWASPKDLSGADSPILLDTAGKLTDAGLGKVSSGLLPAGTVLMSSRAPIGYLAIAGMPTAINQGFIAMKSNDRVPNSFLMLWTRENMEEIKSRANGSTFMEISKAAFRPIPVVLPDEAAMNAFREVSGPLFDRIAENARQAETLTNLRDILLPRLLSGVITVPT